MTDTAETTVTLHILDIECDAVHGLASLRESYGADPDLDREIRVRLGSLRARIEFTATCEGVDVRRLRERAERIGLGLAGAA